MIVCTTSAVGVGGTFVDWSLHYLTGQNKYFSVERNSWIDLVDDPVTDINAHKHFRNHPVGNSQVQEHIGILKNVNAPLHSIYAVDAIKSQTTDIFNICNSAKVEIVYLHVPDYAIGYSWRKRNNYPDTFSWINQQLKIWDKREIIALDIRPFDTAILHSHAPIVGNIVWINCESLWLSPEYTMQNILQRLGLTLNLCRYHSWIDKAHRWRQIQANATKFYRELDYIIKSICQGWDYPLDNFTLMQEAVIQHCLIYNCNLNLRNWGLEKFPNNTKLLHTLLEPNFHNVVHYERKI